MANSSRIGHRVVSIDQQHFGDRLGSVQHRKNPSRRHDVLVRKKLYKLSSKDALTEKQIERLVEAASNSSRHGVRDAALILLAFQHGLKISELINLKWRHIDFDNQRILVSRLQDGSETLHTLQKRELELLRQLQNQHSDLVFQSQRKQRLSSRTIRKIIKQAGEMAGFEKPVYPHMLTGSSGFDLLSVISSNSTRH